jgi:hypothetical protein
MEIDRGLFVVLDRYLPGSTEPLKHREEDAD